VAGGRELGHFEADLGDDHLGGAAADAGDLVEADDDRQRFAAVVTVAGAGIDRRPPALRFSSDHPRGSS
jgi:hypothetical protein